MNTPEFSIIIPTLNEEKYLPKLLESLSQQSLKNFEVIIVDGKSKDKTIDMAETFRSAFKRFVIIESKKASLPYQRNLGAKEAQGEWLVFIDADSVLLPYCMERAKVFIQSTNTSFFTSWCRPDSETPKDSLQTLINNSSLEAGILFERPLAPGPFSLVRRKVFDAVGGYDKKASWGEDMDLTLRIHKYGIHLDLLRETLFILSLRRIRKHGGLKLLTQYVVGGLYVFFFNKALKNMPGYSMGGHLYDKNKKSKDQTFLRYEVKFRNLMKELLG